MIGRDGIGRPPEPGGVFDLAKDGEGITREGPLVYYAQMTDAPSTGPIRTSGLDLEQPGAFVGAFHGPAFGTTHPVSAGSGLSAEGDKIEIVAVVQTGGLAVPGNALGGIAMGNFLPTGAGEVTNNLFDRVATTNRAVVGFSGFEIWLMTDNGSPVSVGTVSTTTNKLYLRVQVVGGAVVAYASVNGGAEVSKSVSGVVRFPWHFAGQAGGTSFNAWPGAYRTVATP